MHQLESIPVRCFMSCSSEVAPIPSEEEAIPENNNNKLDNSIARSRIEENTSEQKPDNYKYVMDCK